MGDSEDKPERKDSDRRSLQASLHLEFGTPSLDMGLPGYIALCFIGLVAALPEYPDIVTPHGNFSTKPLSAADREWIARHIPEHRGSYPPGFKFAYVAQDGRISPNTRPAGNWIRIVASPQTSDKILYVAAMEVHKQLKWSPSHIFNNIASSTAGVGIFSAQETITVFPSFSQYGDTPQCRGRCDGSCKITCTGDGRKYSSLSGLAGQLALILSDNLMCTPSDPYNHHDNIMVHEFAHIIDKVGFSASDRQRKEAAYANARAHSLWRMDSYAMSNSAEYFGEATGAFFLVNLQRTTGGMTQCSYGQCRSEADARYHLWERDPQLYSLLASVYTNNDASKASGLTVCYQH